MATRRALAQQLERVAPFPDPTVDLEQYVTPAEVAASLIHEGDLRGDLARPVVDLGTGTGMLAIAAALRGARAIGVDIDDAPLSVAEQNAESLGVDVAWIRGTVGYLPLCPNGTTVVMNPPFGAQRANRGADRPFLAAAADIATVSYSIHNAQSRAFVERFATDHGGRITDAFAVTLDLPHQFAFHTDAVRSIDAEAYRIDWT